MTSTPPRGTAPCKVKECPGFGRIQERDTCVFCDRRDAFAREHAAQPKKSCEICGGDYRPRGTRSRVCEACKPIDKKINARKYAAKKERKT